MPGYKEYIDRSLYDDLTSLNANVLSSSVFENFLISKIFIVSLSNTPFIPVQWQSGSFKLATKLDCTQKYPDGLKLGSEIRKDTTFILPFQITYMLWLHIAAMVSLLSSLWRALFFRLSRRLSLGVLKAWNDNFVKIVAICYCLRFLTIWRHGK